MVLDKGVEEQSIFRIFNAIQIAKMCREKKIELLQFIVSLYSLCLNADLCSDFQMEDFETSVVVLFPRLTKIIFRRWCFLVEMLSMISKCDNPSLKQ